MKLFVFFVLYETFFLVLYELFLLIVLDETFIFPRLEWSFCFPSPDLFFLFILDFFFLVFNETFLYLVFNELFSHSIPFSWSVFIGLLWKYLFMDRLRFFLAMTKLYFPSVLFSNVFHETLLFPRLFFSDFDYTFFLLGQSMVLHVLANYQSYPQSRCLGLICRGESP